MVQLTERFEFSAAHRLHAAELSEKENHEIFGRCNNANGHGHNYELEVTVFGEPDSHGRVISISELQKIVNSRVVDVFDHKHLNLDCPEFSKLNPTVENIAKIIYEKLATSFSSRAKLRRVRVWETPKTCCEYPA
jgi:6-pyruvoyltetrahydropterin/6-carboxytetrahydropterin synthase